MVRDTTCKDKAGGVAKDDGGWTDFTYTLRGSSHDSLSTARTVTILLDKLPGSGRQRISRAPPHPRSLRDCILFPRGALEQVVAFMNREQGSPVARKSRAISRGFMRFPQLNQGTLQESVSFSLPPVKAMHLHWSKRLKADSSPT